MNPTSKNNAIRRKCSTTTTPVVKPWTIGNNALVFGIPKAFSEHVSKDMLFVVSIDDEGLHYKPAKPEDLEVKTPSWSKK